MAHQGVTNPGVMARMEGMSDLGAATKVLGQMAKGQTAFDAAKAQAAREVIRAEAARVVELFEAPEQDPKSEALPAIWDQFTEFTLKARALEEAAGGDVASLEALRGTFGQIGAACSGCHKAYRK